MIMEDGFKTIIGFAANATVKMEEKEVTPPGISGGGPNEVTTMRNTSLRTNAPKKLKSYTSGALTVHYDPAVYPEIDAMVNANQLVTITFPDGDTLAFWGWIDEFTPNSIVEGEPPTADITIEPSNRNGTGVETAPVYTAPAP